MRMGQTLTRQLWRLIKAPLYHDRGNDICNGERSVFQIENSARSLIAAADLPYIPLLPPNRQS